MAKLVSFVARFRHAPVVAGVFLATTALYFYCAAVLPSFFSKDNYANHQAIEYIAEYRNLPKVEYAQEGVYFSKLGTTRLLRPPITYLVSAACYELSEPFLKDKKLRLRLGSVLLGALTVTVAFIAFLELLGSLSLALLGAALLGFLPRFAIIASSSGDDVGAIFSVTVLFYAAVLVVKSDRPSLALVISAVAIGLILQSKFTAWISLPSAILLIGFAIRNKGRNYWASSLLAIAMSFVAGLWWPIANMLNYGWHDPTALLHAASIQVLVTESVPNMRGFWSQGVGLIELLSNHEGFIFQTGLSTLGGLPWVPTKVDPLVVVLYGTIASALILLIVWNFMTKKGGENTLLSLLFLPVCLLQICVYIHHNLLRDVQVDGRYLLPLLAPVIGLWLSHLFTCLRRAGSQDEGTSFPFLLRSLSFVLILLTGSAFYQNWQANWLRFIAV